MNKIIGTIRGVITSSIFAVNTLFWCFFIFVVAIIKALIPFKFFRKICDIVLDNIAFNWIFCNNIFMKIFKKITWDVQGLEKLKRDEWYLLISNHQTWIDIVVLQKVFYKRIPFLKFFLKKELIWVPILGPAWWALDFPFMKRYSKEFLVKNPHLKGKDLEITRKACEKFTNIPVTVMNFIEGTRFTPQKQKKQQSPYQYLLKPKSGGIAFVLSTMGEYMHKILDVTIAYPDGVETFWEFLCSRETLIRVNVESLDIDKKLVGDYFNDEKFKKQFDKWLNLFWKEKDAKVKKLMKK